MDFRALLRGKLDAQQALLNAAMASGTGFTAEQQAGFEALQAEIVNLENTLKAATELEARQKDLTHPINQPLYPEPKAKHEKFSNFGEQLRAVIEAAKPGGSVDNRLSIKAAAGLNENVGSDGGFLVDDLIIDKGGISAASSIHVRFLYDENCFRFIYRVDGQPVWNTPLIPFKGSNSLSPFVALQSR